MTQSVEMSGIRGIPESLLCNIFLRNSIRHLARFLGNGSFFYTFQKLKKKHDTGFYYIHAEITADPCNLIGSNGAIYSQEAPFPSKLHLSSTQ